ncbi:MAG: hypothetical protein JSV44_12115, partial [Candidatus Zixiibacteriota bacterium]
MNVVTTIPAILLAVMLPLVGFAQNFSIEPGKIAVYLPPPATGNPLDSFQGLADLSLHTHLDYYLWFKGWPFEFVFPDTLLELDEVRALLQNNHFRYLIYLQPRFTFKAKTIPIGPGYGQQSPRNTLVLKAKLWCSWVDLHATDAPGGREAYSASSRRNWLEETGSGRSSNNGHEPPDFVIKRLLATAIAFLPSQE